MKKWAISLFVLMTTLASFAFANPEGRWGVTVQQNGFQFDLVFTIASTQLNLRNTCSGMGQSVSVDVTVPASYTADSIIVHGAAQKQTSQNGLNCEVSLQPGTANYVVNGNQLILKDSSGEQIVLDRR